MLVRDWIALDLAVEGIFAGLNDRELRRNSKFVRKLGLCLDIALNAATIGQRPIGAHDILQVGTQVRLIRQVVESIASATKSAISRHQANTTRRMEMSANFVVIPLGRSGLAVGISARCGRSSPKNDARAYSRIDNDDAFEYYIDIITYGAGMDLQ